MERVLSDYISRVSTTFNRYKNAVLQNKNEEMAIKREELELVNSIQEAIEEWYTAEQFFESVSDPELIDYAIYRLEASRKKYTYLLKKAKDAGIKLEI